MASQEILLSTCDRCTTEVRTPLNRKSKRTAEFILPPGWLHISGNTSSTLIFEMDLCEDCKQIVINIAGKHVHTSSSKPKEKTASKIEDGKDEDENAEEGLRLVETG